MLSIRTCQNISKYFKILSPYYSGTRLRAQEKLVTNLQYEIATSEADDDGFCFPRTTTSQLQDALEALMRNDEEEEVEEEVVEEEVIGLDWVELEDISDVRVRISHMENCFICTKIDILFIYNSFTFSFQFIFLELRNNNNNNSSSSVIKTGYFRRSRQ